jgi:hypothetical protein
MSQILASGLTFNTTTATRPYFSKVTFFGIEPGLPEQHVFVSQTVPSTTTPKARGLGAFEMFDFAFELPYNSVYYFMQKVAGLLIFSRFFLKCVDKQLL